MTRAKPIISALLIGGDLARAVSPLRMNFVSGNEHLRLRTNTASTFGSGAGFRKINRWLDVRTAEPRDTIDGIHHGRLFVVSIFHDDLCICDNVLSGVRILQQQ